MVGSFGHRPRAKRANFGQSSDSVATMIDAWRSGASVDATRDQKRCGESGYQSGLSEGYGAAVTLLIEGGWIPEIVRAAHSRAGEREAKFWAKMMIRFAGAPVCDLCGRLAPSGEIVGICDRHGHGCGGQFIESGANAEVGWVDTGLPVKEREGVTLKNGTANKTETETAGET